MVNATTPSPSANELKLIEVATTFLNELKDLTPGKALEAKLNTDYGPGSKYYDELARLSLIGLEEGTHPPRSPCSSSLLMLVCRLARSDTRHWPQIPQSEAKVALRRAEVVQHHVRHSPLAPPLILTHMHSGVYMETDKGEEQLSGDYHAHPYGASTLSTSHFLGFTSCTGEINMVRSRVQNSSYAPTPSHRSFPSSARSPSCKVSATFGCRKAGPAQCVLPRTLPR